MTATPRPLPAVRRLVLRVAGGRAIFYPQGPHPAYFISAGKPDVDEVQAGLFEFRARASVLLLA